MGGIYTASRTHHANKWKSARARGEPIISTWIDEAGAGGSPSLSDLWVRNINEAVSADALVVLIERDDFPLKGALVEIGAALAAGNPVFVVLDPDIQLEERSMRPVGSWLRHPLVSFQYTLYDAFKAAKALASNPEASHDG